jgi:phage terminase large subunit
MDVQLLTPDRRRYVPLPKQAAFHASDARHRAYIASFGAGKSLCGAVEALLQSLEYPGSAGQGLVGRYDYRELQESTWKTLLDITPPAVVKDEIRSGPKLILKNGFEIVGWNLKDHQKMASLNLAWFWFDECNEDGIDRAVYDQARGRLRDPLGSRSSWLTGNPAGRNWVYELFFAWQDGKRKYADHEGFQATTAENVYLPADYLKGLREFYDDVWIEKYLNGSFDLFEGQVFDNFDRELHVVTARPDSRWPRYRALDHGLINPTACLWAASDFHNNLLIYRCYYQRNAIPEENARNILKLSEGDPEPVWTMIDPSTKQTQSAGGTMEKIIDQYRRAGLICSPGDNRVRDSIALLRQLLAPHPEREFPAWHPRAGEKGSPRLFFDVSCTELLWELTQYQWKQVKPGAADREMPLAKHDHAIAALRYLVMRSPQGAVEQPQEGTLARFLAIAAEIKGEDPALAGGDPLLADVIGNQRVPRRRAFWGLARR